MGSQCFITSDSDCDSDSGTLFGALEGNDLGASHVSFAGKKGKNS